MSSRDCTSPTPVERQLLLSDDLDAELVESSTPEFNLLLDKLTEILRFRSTCRRHHAAPQQTSSSTTSYLKRLQPDGNEPALHQADVTSAKLTTGAWKASNAQQQQQQKSTVAARHSHQQPSNLFANGKRRRLPCLLQRLIDEGNLIKEAVHRLKSQRFSPSCHQQQSNTPSTPTTKSPFASLPSTGSIPIPSALSDSPNPSASSPGLGVSWFLSSNVFATGNHACETGPPRRTWMEIGIHDG